jgi:hypothetical protein
VTDLLLYSLAEFREIILPALEATGAGSVVEIGGEAGLFTRELLAWGEARGALVHCVDPRPSDALRQLVEGSSAGRLWPCRSVEAIPDIGAADAYLIDGDHNYFTLTSELAAIEKACEGRQPLLVLHDVGWPSGRRDMYYDPPSVPDDARHPFDYRRGATLDRSELVDDGFRGDGDFAWAQHEGGPANGVLTAVEDFLADRPGLELHVVPCVFGLGVLFETSSPAADQLRTLLARHEGNALLGRLERNRLELYLHVLRLQFDLDRTREDAALRIRDVEVENRGLWARVGELEGRLRETDERLAALSAEVTSTVDARSFALAELLSRVHRRLGHGPGISAARLRALARSSGTTSPSSSEPGRRTSR